MEATGTNMKTPEALSLQARLEQLEAAITEGHAIVDRISAGRDPSETQPTAEGATPCADRCQGGMNELNQRLTSIANQLGTL